MEPIAKRQRTSSAAPRIYHGFPAEIRNQLYRCAALPDRSEQVTRSYTFFDGDGSVVPMDAVHSFYIDNVSENGRSTLFNRNIIKVTEITEEVLTLVTPWVLFTFKTSDSLSLFAEAFYSHYRICKRTVDIHVELDLTAGMHELQLEAFAKWEETAVPHGTKENAHGVFQDWLKALQGLPTDSTHVHLVFPHFWRDFRSLRGLSAATGLAKFQVTFAFPPNADHTFSKTDFDFLVSQTMAAVMGVEVVEQSGINKKRREELVRYGCRGFNRPVTKKF